MNFDTRDARDTERRGNINCKRYDLVSKKIDTDCRQLDSKLCDLIYLLVALIFCHVWRSILLRRRITRVAISDDGETCLITLVSAHTNIPTYS